jgi:hypothetical protein
VAAEPDEGGWRAHTPLEGPGCELQRLVARVKQGRFGEVEVDGQLGALGSAPAQQPLDLGGDLRGALPGASRMLNCARATDGITVRGSPAVSMFTSTAARAPCAPRTPRRPSATSRRPPRRSCPRRSAGAPRLALRVLERRHAGPQLLATRPSRPGSTSRSTCISTWSRSARRRRRARVQVALPGAHLDRALHEPARAGVIAGVRSSAISESKTIAASHVGGCSRR